MSSWKKLFKDLTVRSHMREVRPHQPTEAEQGSDEPIRKDDIREILGKSSDIVFRDFIIKGREDIPCTLAVVDGLVDSEILDNFVLKPLMIQADSGVLGKATAKTVNGVIRDHLAPVIELKTATTRGEAIDAILSGDAVLFTADNREALVIGARGWINRGVPEPQVETVVRGPREGFSETLRINTSLIRRKIKNPSLRIVSLKMGEVTRTDIAVVYIEGIARKELVSEVLRRLSRIKIDGVLSSNYIEEMVEDNPYTPFPQVTYTEKPDVLAANLLEGKVGILIDGDPTVLMIPNVMAKFFQTGEDYYERAMIVVLIRFLRYLASFIALLAPSFYIAATTFHQEIIPTKMLLSISASRQGVPEPAVLEALLMIIVLEVLQEAGVRLPKPVGAAIGIVGALVIGDAAVKANLASPVMVLVIGITAVATYSIPSYDMAIAIRLLRIPMIFVSGLWGFFGLALGLYALLIHLLALRCFGIPYLSPIAPFRPRAFFQDTFVRTPWWGLKTRPELADTPADTSADTEGEN